MTASTISFITIMTSATSVITTIIGNTMATITGGPVVVVTVISA